MATTNVTVNLVYDPVTSVVTGPRVALTTVRGVVRYAAPNALKRWNGTTWQTVWTPR